MSVLCKAPYIPLLHSNTGVYRGISFSVFSPNVVRLIRTASSMWFYKYPQSMFLPQLREIFFKLIIFNCTAMFCIWMFRKLIKTLLP